MLGALVGLRAEAKILKAAFPTCLIAISGATKEGAARGVASLKRAGARELLSFGCAAGLSPDVSPGTVFVPDWVNVGGTHRLADSALSARFGGGLAEARHGGLLHSDHLVTRASEKARLYAETGCQALDMESGVVAETGMPFAVLRVVCDDSTRDLPSVACDILAAGKISVRRLVGGLLRQPGQITDLIALGRDASMAHGAMQKFLYRIS